MISLRAAMIRFYNQYEKEMQKVFIGTIVTFVLLNATFVCLLLCLFNQMYMPYLFKEISFFPSVFLGVLSLGTETVYLLYQSLLQARQEGTKYSLNSIIYLFFHASTVVIFVLILRKGIIGMLFSNLITNVVFAVYGIWSMYRNKYMIFVIDKKILFKSLKYSLPILPHNLSNNLSVYSVKLIINNFLSYTWSGIFTLASQFATIMNLVQSSINLAFRPWFIEQMELGEEGRKQIKHISGMIMSLISFCAVGVSLFSKELIIIMSDSSYINAWRLVPFFVLTQLVAFIYYSHVQTLMYNLKMSKFAVICSFSGLITNIVVSLILVEKLEIVGIMIGQIGSQIVMAFITVILSNKAEHVDFGLHRMITDILSATVFIVVGMWISMSSSEERIQLISIVEKLIVIAIAFIIYIVRYGNDYIVLLKGIIQKKCK